MEILGVAEKAAIACAAWNGKGDKVAADQAATTAMREAFNEIDFSGRIVIGEGERDEAPMLFIGEELGRGGEEIDIAVDPLEGTNLCAANKPNALTTIAIAPRGALLFAPDTYMEKIAAGPACAGKVGIEKTPAENIAAVAAAYGKPASEVSVCISTANATKTLSPPFALPGRVFALSTTATCSALSPRRFPARASICTWVPAVHRRAFWPVRGLKP